MQVVHQIKTVSYLQMGNQTQKEFNNKDSQNCCQYTNLFLKPEYDSIQLTNYLQHFKSISKYCDQYYGECHVLQSNDGIITCVLQKQSIRKSQSQKRLKLLRQFQMSKKGPATKYLIGTTIIANIEKPGFFWTNQEIYIEHDFILTDLSKEFQCRNKLREEFTQKQIRTIVQACTKGFLWLELTEYSSVRMDHIYFCGASKDIKVAHPSIFSYRSNIEQVYQDEKYAINNYIYLSPEELSALECGDSKYQGGWVSNAFTFGMNILSLMTMQTLSHVYNYQTCEIYYQKIEELLHECSGQYSMHLLDIVRQLLRYQRKERISFLSLYEKMEKMHIPAFFPNLFILDPYKASQNSPRRKKETEENKTPNYLSLYLKPLVSKEGQKPIQEEKPSQLQEDEVIANKRVSYIHENEVAGKYLGDVVNIKSRDDDEHLRQGKGIYRHIDGQSYIGEWLRGKMHGFGKLYYADQKLRYEGQFKEGLFHGYGIQHAQYQIQERQDEIDRKYIKIYHGNWIEYEGCYKEDLKCGPGKIVFRKGSWRGNFQDGQPNGQGIYCSSRGIEFKGKWENGELIQ